MVDRVFSVKQGKTIEGVRYDPSSPDPQRRFYRPRPEVRQSTIASMLRNGYIETYHGPDPFADPGEGEQTGTARRQRGQQPARKPDVPQQRVAAAAPDPGPPPDEGKNDVPGAVAALGTGDATPPSDGE